MSAGKIVISYRLLILGLASYSEDFLSAHNLHKTLHGGDPWAPSSTIWSVTGADRMLISASVYLFKFIFIYFIMAKYT